MAKMIVHIVWGFRLGGIETMLVNIINEQVNHASVTLIIINNLIDENLIASLDKRVRIIRLRRGIGSKNPIPFLRLNLMLLRQKPDIIHCHTHTIIELLNKSLHKRTSLTVHTTITDKHMRESSLRKYAKIFAISPAVQQVLQQNFGVNSTIVYNGIDFSKFACKTEYKPHTPFRIVQVGRLIEPKGHRTLLHAIAKLPHLNISLDIIGSGEEEQTLKDIVAKANIENIVKFRGSMSQEELHLQLKEYDLLVQPSLFEGFGLTVVEAMAARVPVLVSSIDSLTDVIGNGRYGQSFIKADSDDCAKQIANFIEHPYCDKQLDDIHNYAQANFDVKQTAINYLNEYNTL